MKARKITTTIPKGLYPPGTCRPIRGNPDKMAATDTPIEVPVYVYYERHYSEPQIGKARGSGRLLTDLPPAPQLLGWTVTVDSYTFGTEVAVKIGHTTDAVEVFVNGEKVHTGKKRARPGSQRPPNTAPRFDRPVGFAGNIYADGKRHYPDKEWNRKRGLVDDVADDPVLEGDDFVEEDDFIEE